MTVPEQLKVHGIRANKRLGQHWLVDSEAVDQVFQAADIAADDTVVEVGAGPGLLTPGLAQRAGRVVAIEFDRNVIPALRAETAGIDNLEIIEADVLKFDPAKLPQPYSVVANLPYYITSAILKHFLESPAGPKTMTVTIQAEVAERIIATPPDMSVLAISVQVYGNPRIAARISRESFWPAPQVDSAVLRIDDIDHDISPKLGGLSAETFFKVVRAGFAEKRKQLHNTLTRNLELSHEDGTALLRKARIDPSRRAETLTIGEWVQLGHAYQTSTGT